MREGDKKGISEGYSLHALAFAALNQDEKALEGFNEAIKLNPNDAVAYYNHGFVYCKLKRYEDAIDDYNKAIELNPNFAKAYENKGRTYFEMEEYEEAARDFKTAGILFYKQRSENCMEMFSICFDLRDKIKRKREDIVFCGLALYLLTKDEKILEELKTRQVDDETMRRILEFTLRKSSGKEISEEVGKKLEKEEREEIRLLLELLKLKFD